MRKENMDTPKQMKHTSRRLFDLLMAQKGKFLLIIVSAFFFSLLMSVAPLILGQGLDNLIAVFQQDTWNWQDFWQSMMWPAVFLVGIWLLISLFSLLQEYTMASVSETLTLTLRKQVSDKFNRLPIGFYDSHHTGDILSRVILDLDKVSEVLQVGLMQLITATMSIVFGVIAMLYLSPLLTVGVLLILLVSAFTTKYLANRNLRYFTENQETLGAVSSRAEEFYTANPLIKAYNQQGLAEKELSELSERQFKAFRKAQFVSAAINPFVRFINQLGFILSAVVGGFMVIQGRMSIGLIQAYLQYINQVSEPITQASYILNTLQSALASLERIFEILDYAEEAEGKQLPLPQEIEGKIDFEDVSFGYSKEKLLMAHVGFSVQPKQTVAIVGPTGAGKTTMINLLMRFYPLNGGKIMLDGQDMMDYSAAGVRKIFGMVLQDTWLFQGTIAENIAYGKSDASREEIIAAANAAQCDHFIRTLPEGYDTVIGSESELSQGQQQLLTIARAILANPKILILDEATSSVDTRTEQMIQTAMDNLTQDRTSFIIAHRLSTIQNADLILVMKNGAVVEKGAHTTLLSKKTLYAQLYNSQFATS